MRTTISALVIVHNEEKMLDTCLQKLKFCNEIIIVLDNSTDNSENISLKYTNKIYSGKWEIEGDRRNFGISKCNSEWVLEIDADEYVSIELAKEIIETINNQNNHYLNYHIKINNYIGTTLVKNGWGGSFGVGGVTRLCKKGTKSWGKQRVHPEIKFTGAFGPDLKNPLDHYFVENISGLIKKFDNWTYLKSLDLIDQNKKDTLRRNIRRIFTRFIKNYYKRKGYKEGKIGFLIALFAGLFPIVSFLRAELKKDIRFKNII